MLYHGLKTLGTNPCRSQWANIGENPTKPGMCYCCCVHSLPSNAFDAKTHFVILLRESRQPSEHSPMTHMPLPPKSSDGKECCRYVMTTNNTPETRNPGERSMAGVPKVDQRPPEFKFPKGKDASMDVTASNMKEHHILKPEVPAAVNPKGLRYFILANTIPDTHRR